MYFVDMELGLEEYEFYCVGCKKDVKDMMTGVGSEYDCICSRCNSERDNMVFDVMDEDISFDEKLIKIKEWEMKKYWS